MTQTLPPDLGTDRLAEILEQLPVAVTVIDLDGRMLYYNEYGGRHLDRKPEYLGGDIRDCHQKDESTVKIDRMLTAFKDGRREAFAYEAARYGGTIRVTFVPYETEGRLIGCIQTVTFKD